jgi:hypothetical protein
MAQRCGTNGPARRRRQSRIEWRVKAKICETLVLELSRGYVAYLLAGYGEPGVFHLERSHSRPVTGIQTVTTILPTC